MITITWLELKEMIRRMELAGATQIGIDVCVNCDTGEIEEMHFDAMDKNLFLDIDCLWSYYLD